MAFMRAKREKTCENAREPINTAPAPMAPSLVDKRMTRGVATVPYYGIPVLSL